MNKTNEPNQFIIHALAAHIETSCVDVMNARPAVQVAARVEFKFGGKNGSR